MNKRECKRLFYKESVRSLLIAGWALGYISPNAINYVTKKLEKITKLKLRYYLHNNVEEDCFVIRKRDLQYILNKLNNKNKS